MRVIQLLACSTTFFAVWSLPQSHEAPLPPFEGEETTNLDTNTNSAPPQSNSDATINPDPAPNPSSANKNDENPPNTRPLPIDDSNKRAQEVTVAQSVPLGNYLLTAAGASLVAHAGTRYWYAADQSSSPSSSNLKTPSTPQHPPPIDTPEGRDFWRNWKPGDGGLDFSHRDGKSGNNDKEKGKGKMSVNVKNKKSGAGAGLPKGIVVEHHIYEMELSGQKGFMECMSKNWNLPDVVSSSPLPLILFDTPSSNRCFHLFSPSYNPQLLP